MNLLEAALDYYRLGWSLIPMTLTEKKKPAIKWKAYQTKRVAERRLRTWFANGSQFGIGVIFGEVSGWLASRDFDDMESYQRWASIYPDLARTLPTVKTRRGRHVYGRTTQQSIEAVRQLIGKPDGTGAIDLGDGELRAGVGCYSVLPPSPHPSGIVYEWLIPVTLEMPTIDLIEAGFWSCHRDHRVNTGVPREPMTLLGGVAGSQPQQQPQRQQTCPMVSKASRNTPSSLLHDAVDLAIERTVPTDVRQRHTRIFEFARELKAIPGLADAEVDDLRPFVRRWHEESKQHYKATWEEHWFDFAEGWDKVKFPAGQEPINLIFKKAMETDLPEVAHQYDSIGLRRLVALCRELQRAAGTGPIFLAVRTAGRLLKVDPATVARWLRGLCIDKVLSLEERGTRARRKASRFRYRAAL